MMNHNPAVRRLFTPTAIVSLLMASVALAPAAGAQVVGGLDPRFQPWIGCWRTMDAGIGLEEVGSEKQPTRACVVPSTSTPGSVDVALYHRDALLSRNTVPLPGSSREKTVDECIGTESSMWDPTDTRLILRADLACARGVKRVETGIMAMNGAGQWVQLQNLAVGRNEATTVARFRFEGDSAAPAGLHFGAVRSTRALRLSTGAPAGAQDVIGVATHVPASLAEAWLLETGQPFKLNASTLVKLADSGVPPRVIDVMVAMANPQRFQVTPAPVNAGVNVASTAVASRSTIGGGGSRCAMLDDFCYGPGGMGAWGFGWRYGAYDPWGYYSPWGPTRFGPYGYGYNVGYGYNPYSLGWGPGYGGGVYYGNGPVVIIPANPTAGDGTVRGRAVNGRGYTRGGDAGPRTNVMPSYTPPSSNTGSGGTGGGSSAGGSAGGGSSSGGRTAKPRPPL